MQIELTRSEAIAAKIAKIRRYVNAKPAKGIPSYIMITLMEYEDELTEYYQQKVGEYRHYSGDYWEPPTDELINEEDVERMVEEAIDEATRFDSWDDLNEEDMIEMDELLEDYDEVLQTDFNRRMAGTIWGAFTDDTVRVKSAV